MRRIPPSDDREARRLDCREDDDVRAEDDRLTDRLARQGAKRFADLLSRLGD
jgi:hypothetical protein